MEGRVTTRTMLAITVLQERILALFYPSGMLRNSKRKKKIRTKIQGSHIHIATPASQEKRNNELTASLMAEQESHKNPIPKQDDAN